MARMSADLVGLALYTADGFWSQRERFRTGPMRLNSVKMPDVSGRIGAD